MVVGFKCGRISLEDDPSEGRSKRASEIIAKTQDLVLNDRRLTQIDLIKQCEQYFRIR